MCANLPAANSVGNAVTAFGNGDVLGGLLSLGQGAADLFNASKACFTAEMLLDWEWGKIRADLIKVGHLLWARDENDPFGLVTLKRVEEVFKRVARIWNVHVAGQILRTTAEHPFRVWGRGWIPAGMLEIGDLLMTRDGRLVPVEGVADSGQVETVYNWRVADYHTYFVSATEDGESVWAHNIYDASKTGPKTDNRFGHNRAIRKVAKSIDDGTLLINGQQGKVVAGGRRGLNEAVVDTTGGFKNSRRPDIMVKLQDGRRVGINVGRVDAAGSPVPREMRAMGDLANFGNLPMSFVSFNR